MQTLLDRVRLLHCGVVVWGQYKPINLNLGIYDNMPLSKKEKEEKKELFLRNAFQGTIKQQEWNENSFDSKENILVTNIIVCFKSGK